jgi:hypothetical protein
MKLIRVTRPLMILIAITFLSSGLVVYAATTLFTQNFPGQTFSTADLIENSACGDTGSGGQLVLVTSLSTIPSVAGQSASLLFGCSNTGTSADYAFSTPLGSGTVSVTPTFTVPKGWVLGYVYASTANGGGGIGGCTTDNSMTSGTPVSFTLGTTASSSELEYCLVATSASTFVSFGITWSQ